VNEKVFFNFESKTFSGTFEKNGARLLNFKIDGVIVSHKRLHKIKIRLSLGFFLNEIFY